MELGCCSTGGTERGESSWNGSEQTVIKENYGNRKCKEKSLRKKHCPPAQLHEKELEEEQALLQQGECCTHTFIKNRQPQFTHCSVLPIRQLLLMRKLLSVLGNVELSRCIGLNNRKASLLVPKT